MPPGFQFLLGFGPCWPLRHSWPITESRDISSNADADSLAQRTIPRSCLRSAMECATQHTRKATGNLLISLHFWAIKSNRRQNRLGNRWALTYDFVPKGVAYVGGLWMRSHCALRLVVVLPLAFWGSVAAVLKFLRWASVIASTCFEENREPNLAQWITCAYAMEALVRSMFCARNRLPF
jgi:hypothetical protein